MSAMCESIDRSDAIHIQTVGGKLLHVAALSHVARSVFENREITEQEVRTLLRVHYGYEISTDAAQRCIKAYMQRAPVSSQLKLHQPDAESA